MSQRDEAGLRRLKQDLDEAEWPAPELLARYATEPNRLSEAEKQQVERALAANPLVADELATLRGFDFARLDADRREVLAMGRSSASAAGSDAVSLFEKLRRALLRPPVFAALMAAAALLLWLARSADRVEAPTAPPAAPPTFAEQPPPATTPSEAPPGVDEPSPPSALASGTPERREQDEPNAERAEAPESSAGGAEALAGAEAPKGAGAPNDAPASKPTRPDAGAELLLAMGLPDYHPAYGRDPMADGAWIVRGSDEPAIRITALAPDHVVRACSASPVLHWSVDRRPEAGEFRLSIVDEDGAVVVDDRKLAGPLRAGLQRVDLAKLGIALPAGRTLRWSIALREDDESPPTAFDFGWLRVEPPAAAEADALASRREGERAAGYAELGCYAEAVEAVLDVRRRQPENTSAERALTRLAEQGGLSTALFRE